MQNRKKFSIHHGGPQLHDDDEAEVRIALQWPWPSRHLTLAAADWGVSPEPSQAAVALLLSGALAEW